MRYPKGLIILVFLIPLVCNAQTENLDSILNGIENAQEMIQNFRATFTIIPLFNESFSSPTLAGDYKIEVPEWLWTRNRVKAVIKHYVADKNILERANYSKPYTTQYYAFNGMESLRFDKEYLEKGIQGYLISERDPYDMITALTPNRLWFNNMSYPSFLLIDIFKKRIKRFSINTVRYEGKESIDGHLCCIIYCEFKFIAETPEGLYPTEYFKIWVDREYNYIFRKVECGFITSPTPQPFDYHVTDKIQVAEVIPGFYLPIGGRFIIYKSEDEELKSMNGQKIKVTYKGINLPIKDEDFWFPMRPDRLIYNTLIPVWGKNLEEYEKNLQKVSR